MPDKEIADREQRIKVQHEYASIEQFVDEYVTNISRSGAFIHTREPVPVGTIVDLKFTVVDDDLYTIEGVGEVVRNQVDPMGIGVVFVMLTSHSKNVLERLVTRRTRATR